MGRLGVIVEVVEKQETNRCPRVPSLVSFIYERLRRCGGFDPGVVGNVIVALLVKRGSL